MNYILTNWVFLGVSLGFWGMKIMYKNCHCNVFLSLRGLFVIVRSFCHCEARIGVSIKQSVGLMRKCLNTVMQNIGNYFPTSFHHSHRLVYRNPNSCLAMTKSRLSFVHRNDNLLTLKKPTSENPLAKPSFSIS